MGPFGRLIVLWAWISVLVPSVVVLGLVGFLGYRGLAHFDLALFFGNAVWWKALFGQARVFDGLWPAMAGTLVLVLLSSLMAIPLGVAGGVLLAEYARGRMKTFLAFAVDLLAGIPSILMGLFGFALILFLKNTLWSGANTGLWLSAICLGILVLPYLINTTASTLAGLPESMKLIGPSLGFTRCQTMIHVLLPLASRGILGGVILAVGRAAEDTAVILMTGVVANAGLPRSLLDKYEALPFKIFYTAAEYRTPQDLDRGFAGALVLLTMTALLFILAHGFQRSLERKWKIRGRQ